MEQPWPIRLFNKSVLKQRKFKEITTLLGPTHGLHCLDIGSDNGVISYLLRQRGGTWKSADLDAQSVAAIRELVQSEVYQIEGGQTPFQDNEFDRVVIVDFLEHIPNDGECLEELFRVLKPDGELIINVPHIKPSLLRRFRLAIGQTDEKHGHLRPGYTRETLLALAGERFALEQHKTYSRFFSELIDTLIVHTVYLLKQHKNKKKQQSHKGAIVTGQDLSAYKSMFRLYSLIYPIIWIFARLDQLLFWRSGYMLIVRARVRKAMPLRQETGHTQSSVHPESLRQTEHAA
jgi:ubiquinone/menaquinone biosynthesis C-methylase UbiE